MCPLWDSLHRKSRQRYSSCQRETMISDYRRFSRSPFATRISLVGLQRDIPNNGCDTSRFRTPPTTASAPHRRFVVYLAVTWNVINKIVFSIFQNISLYGRKYYYYLLMLWRATHQFRWHMLNGGILFFASFVFHFAKVSFVRTNAEQILSNFKIGVHCVKTGCSSYAHIRHFARDRQTTENKFILKWSILNSQCCERRVSCVIQFMRL